MAEPDAAPPAAPGPASASPPTVTPTARGPRRSPPTWWWPARSASARCVAGDDDLWWSELRPEEGGRVMVVRHTPGGRRHRRAARGLLGPHPGARVRRGRLVAPRRHRCSSPTGPTSACTGSTPDAEPDTFQAAGGAHPRARPAPRRPLRRRRGQRRRALGDLRARAAPGRRAPRPRNEIVAVDAEPGGEPVVLVSGARLRGRPPGQPRRQPAVLAAVEPPRHALGRHRAVAWRR